ncbi:hypothetical protein [Rugosimonospora africana]|uniref:Uncharacterized protein n=1 Tax=Rugosimonospora africana TaxID=556532 RepID=A0A8J3QXK5_9ACTN|nr:hypothetical protein [Rugosimonospora africana]GIH17678.1 hypothetical protein Raf01_58500 [Rugosimonospora africana]
MIEGYVRFQSPDPNARGTFPGIFALVNGLARRGTLTAAQERFWRENNEWFTAAYPDPSTVDPSVYDRAVNPGAAAWFKTSAGPLLDRVDGYLEILAHHGVACVRLERAEPPGRVLYEDEYQIVVAPAAP